MGACGSSSKKNNCSNCPGNPRDCLQPFTVSAKNFTKNSRPVHGQSFGTKSPLPPHMTKNTKLFAWDFHGTLEEGVEVGFFEILKQLKKEYKTEVKITLSEVRKKYGVSVADYLRHFFLTSESVILTSVLYSFLSCFKISKKPTSTPSSKVPWKSQAKSLVFFIIYGGRAGLVP